jgi:hypothetical protein
MTMLRRIALSSFLLVGLLPGIVHADRTPWTPSDPVTITEVKVGFFDHGPVVLLQAEGKAIPILVDLTVALSIQVALSSATLPRPLSHDLRQVILETFGGHVTQTIITLKEGNYYGSLTVVLRDEVRVFDSRSSDSIALAIHFKAPIIVGRDLLSSAWHALGQSKAEDL